MQSFFAKLKDEDQYDDSPKEAPTVVQSEGWLLMKRGPGVSKQESSVHRGGPAAPPPDMRTSVDDDTVSVFQSAAPPIARKSRIGSIVARLKGTDEKRYYFVLLTTRARDGRGNTSTIRTPRAELRYYKQKPTPPDNFSNPAGTIQLQTSMEHQLRDSVIRLSTTEKSFMFRIDPADMNSARARTALSQWLHAIQFSLNALATFSHQRKTAGGRFQPINVHPLHSLDADAGSAPPPTLPAEYETRRKARKSVSKREDGIRQSTNNDDGENGANNPFVELWEFYGIDGYDAVIDHFGPARTDLERLLGHFTSRAAQFQCEVQILETQLGHSTEIVVKEQRTIAYAMRELHKTNERNLRFAKQALRDMNQHVVQEIAQTLHEMSSRLEDIETKCETSVNYIHGAKRVLLEADERVVRLTALVAGNAQQQLAAPATKVPGARRKSEATPEKLEFDLNGARQARRDASQTLVTIEAKCAEAITEAMISCYELEMFRFESVQRIMQAAAKLETTLEAKKFVETPLETVLNAIDAPRDMRYTFAKLKAMGEKTRPNGRMRRKNSTVNRVLLDLMPDEEEDEEETEDNNQHRAQFIDEWLAL